MGATRSSESTGSPKISSQPRSSWLPGVQQDKKRTLVALTVVLLERRADGLQQFSFQLHHGQSNCDVQPGR